MPNSPRGDTYRMIKRNIAFATLLLLLATGGCSKNEPVPVAGFAFSGDNAYKIPCIVHFANQSATSYSYEWWFGTDSSRATIDTAGSRLKDPVFRYSRPGKYSVTLRAYTESRREWAEVTRIISIADTVR